jgi:pilus assembly protein CpaF
VGKQTQEVIMDDNQIIQALGPLAPLYEDPDVTEIMVDAPDKVFFERRDVIKETDITFGSPGALQQVIDGLLKLGEVKVTPTQTTGHIRLHDGTRILAVVPPTAISGPYLVIRKTRGHRLDIDKLLSFRFINQEVVTTLKTAIEARINIMVAGGTGSGKTTFSNILTDLFPASERIIVVERLFEMQLWHPRVVRLAADGSPDLSFEDLIETASRMRPDRLVFGEVKGPEAYRMLEVINLGHDGSLMSIHATSIHDALKRLEAFCLMANLGLGIPQIR